MVLRALSYYGGKSPARSGGVCHWIRDLLPWEKHQCYVEPFAGMLGVLLSRERVTSEVANDKNDRVINWWRAVRDHGEEFAYMVDTTPCSRAEFDWSIENIDNAELSVPKRALAFHTIISQSVLHADRNSPAWALCKLDDITHRRFLRHREIMLLAERLDCVQLEIEDACDIIERFTDTGHALLYCDPPYRTSTVSAYRVKEVDVDRMSAALKAVKGHVAVSGYGDEWGHIGFERHIHKSYIAGTIGTATQAKRDHARVEVLWTNFAPAARLF